jgi:hypothetical protein
MAEIEALLGQTVVVRIPPDASWARQVAGICLVDLLARLLPRLRVDSDPQTAAHPRLPPGPQTLTARLDEARTHSLLAGQEALGDPALTIAVGGAAGDIYIDGDGWLSYLGETPSGLEGVDETNPIGPLAAACRGASQVVQRLLGDRLPATTRVAESYWSALTLGPVAGPDAGNPPIPSPVLDALLMGGGSIGGATAYAFARVPELGGTIAVVDPERLEDRNSRKALLARRADIAARARKIDVAASELEHLAALSVDRFEGTLAEYVAAGPADRPLPLVISAVDSIPARRELADHMPLEALNAGCGDTHISVSGHRTDDGPCIYCLYVDRVLDREATRAKMIQRETGLPPGFIDEYRIKRLGLPQPVLSKIATNRGRPPDSLSHREGMTLDELFEAEFLYGEVRLQTDDESQSTLQLTFVPALAGVLLAGEALKAASEELRQYRLGPYGAAPDIEYTESLLQAPIGLLTRPPRWPTNECLCRSVRRLRLMRQRYGLDP